jgi:thiamine-phosphate pyrophosphorylase
VNRTAKPIGRLHVITDTVVQTRFTHAEIAAMAAEGGAECVQLRDKRLSRDELLAVAREVLRICRRFTVPVIINDSVEVAADTGADGVHLGRSDTSIPRARETLGPDKIIGGSAGSLEEMIAVERDGADYAGFGHVFPTGSKSKPGRPVGLDTLSKAVRAARIPVIAIGGIDADNLASVMAAGAWGAAVIGAVCGSDDPVRATRDLRRIIDAAQGA